MPKKTAKKTGESKKKTQASAKKMVSGPLAQGELDAVLESFHRVLRNKGVTQPVRVRLAGPGGNLCPEWRCVTLANGEVRCGWVVVPC